MGVLRNPIVWASSPNLQVSRGMRSDRHVATDKVRLTFIDEKCDNSVSLKPSKRLGVLSIIARTASADLGGVG